MIVRPLMAEDITKVRSIHERSSDFPLPDFCDSHYVIKEVAVKNDKIIGVGLLRTTSEAILILDLDEARSDRAQAIEELLRTGIWKCQKIGIDEIHSFLTGEITYSFADVLKRKFGFVNCEGIPL